MQKKLSNLVKKKLFGKISYPSLRYRYFSKLLENDFGGKEGATTLAISPICKPGAARDLVMLLAYSLSSELNVRVLLVDTVIEPNSKSLSVRLNAKSKKGFIQLISNKGVSLEDSIVKTPVKNVFLLPSGANEDTIRFIIDPEKLTSTYRDLSLFVDYVIFLQDDIRVDTRYINLSYLVDINLLLAEENVTLLSDIDECQSLYDDNNISKYKLILT